MNKEDKELLLKDLCARLPYNVVVRCHFADGGVLDTDDIADLLYNEENSESPMYKPYLRQMYSMTDEEQHEYNLIAMHTIVTSKGFVHIEATDLIDWLNAHYFDYRGLIDRGLAIEVTDSNNPYN